MPDIASRAAALLLAARRDPARRLADLPAELRPADRAAAYAIQREVAGTFAAIGGWKVSPFLPDGPPFCGPMPAAGILGGPATLSSTVFLLRGVEAELAARLGRDLPPRATPYTREEVADAIAALHPAIEILQSRFVEPTAVAPLTGLADTQAHGAFVHGVAVAGWRGIDLAAESVVQLVDGVVNAARTGHPGGDLLGQVVWLANEGSLWAGGLKAGQFVTCGSWTGANRVGAAARVRVAFSTLGEVALDFTTVPRG
jgi:2-keto-4-pentenoate hydratase